MKCGCIKVMICLKEFAWSEDAYSYSQFCIQMVVHGVLCSIFYFVNIWILSV